MFPDAGQPRRAGGSALMIALFVIVVMALLAAAMGRILVDSSEKNTVEVRSVRALLAAQSGLEITLYRLFPNRTLLQPLPLALCDASFATSFPGNTGLAGCKVEVSCVKVPVTYNGMVTNGYRLVSTGACGVEEINSTNPDFAVSRTLTADAYDGETL